MKHSLICAASSAAMLAAAPMAAGQKDDGAAPNNDIAGKIAALTTSIEKSVDLLKEDNLKLRSETGEGVKKFEDFKSQVDEKLSDLNAMREEIRDLQQKSVRGGGSDAPAQSPGQKFAAADGLKSLSQNRTSGGRFSMEIDGSLGVKDISSANDPGSTAGSAGALIVPDRRGLVDLPRRRLTVRGLMTVGSTDSSLIEYERLTADTNAAAPVAEGAAAPQSELTFEDKSASVVDIAHFMRANRNILDDAPRLASFIDGRLRYGLGYKEELQILLGSGTGGNMEGLVTAATAYSAPFVLAGRTQIDVLRLALLQAVVGEHAPNGMVLNHIDWAKIETTKDTTGRYIIGNPQGSIAPTLWNQPIVPTNAMTADNFLVGDFALGAELLDRETATVEASTEDQDNFIKRKVTVMGVSRVAMPIYRPDAFITGTYTAAMA